jgi:predicted nuclease of predicted toxin-antitoxin system
MSLSIVIDMNLSFDWVDELARHGFVAVHWSTVGDPRASDDLIMDWARINNHIVLTHDLDFGTTLALTHASGPSVVQVRGKKVLPEDVGVEVITALRLYETELAAGALIVIELNKSRVRVLPL